MRTQVSAKYTIGDDLVFKVRRALTAAGVEVVAPASNEFVAEVNGVGYTFDPDHVSIAEIEEALFQSIAVCSFHTICNATSSQPGYLGRSAAIESAFAIRSGRPALRIEESVIFGSEVPSLAREVVSDHLGGIPVIALLGVEPEELRSLLADLASRPVDYDADDSVWSEVDKLVGEHLMSFRDDRHG